MIKPGKVKVDLKKHKALKSAIENGTGPVRETLESFEKLYRSFALRRFDKFSRGGGDWPKNSAGTRKGKRSSAILVDTRIMRLGLGFGIRSIKTTKNSVTFAFVNPSAHPGAGISIAELASIHDKGQGVPKRKILVRPDQETVSRMLDMVKRKFMKGLK